MTDKQLSQQLTSFIRGLYPGLDTIPLHAPVFGTAEKNYVLDCLETTFVSSVGKYVTQFETALCNYTHTNAVVLCVNGTEALTLALKLAGVGQGTEVITQPLSFVATANAIVHAGGNPVFVDIDKDTLGMSASSLLQFLQQRTEMVNGKCINKHTKRTITACVPMHTFGHPAQIDKIADICCTYGITLVEDAAESLGSTYKGRHTGTFGAMGVISFNGNKTITTGGGGAILFDDVTLANHARHLTTQAKIPHAWKFEHDYIAYNLRMPNINAALGLAQLEKLDSFIISKRATAEAYSNFFQQTGIQFFREPQHSQSNYWLNTIICNSIMQRDVLLDYLNNNKIQARPAWELLSGLAIMQGYETFELMNATALAERILSLPSSPRYD